CYRV
ncbi:hypothetical protein D046_3067B, partial [Vibrio parahaemolyticus V-223/04]